VYPGYLARARTRALISREPLRSRTRCTRGLHTLSCGDSGGGMSRRRRERIRMIATDCHTDSPTRRWPCTAPPQAALGAAVIAASRAAARCDCSGFAWTQETATLHRPSSSPRRLHLDCQGAFTHGLLAGTLADRNHYEPDLSQADRHHAGRSTPAKPQAIPQMLQSPATSSSPTESAADVYGAPAAEADVFTAGVVSTLRGTVKPLCSQGRVKPTTA